MELKLKQAQKRPIPTSRIWCPLGPIPNKRAMALYTSVNRVMKKSDKRIVTHLGSMNFPAKRILEGRDSGSSMPSANSLK